MIDTLVKNYQIENNVRLASIFQQMAACYKYLGKEDRFRALAYENVARVLLNMQQDIAKYATDLASLDAVSGIGPHIAKKIIEYFATGTMSTFETLKKQVPYDLLNLMEIDGIGPATLRHLVEQLKITNKNQLTTLLSSNDLKKVKGISAAKVEQIKRALMLQQLNARMPLQEAKKIGKELLGAINKIEGVEKSLLAGSIRRKQTSIGDIDILIQVSLANRKKMIRQLIALPMVKKVMSTGITKLSLIVNAKKEVHVDIRIVDETEYGAAMLYFTGSKAHNIKLRALAKTKGYKINEYGIFYISSGEKLPCYTEEEIYRVLQINFIPPEKRLGKNEIEIGVIKEHRLSVV